MADDALTLTELQTHTVLTESTIWLVVAIDDAGSVRVEFGSLSQREGYC
jgi:hypothetical protein